LTSERRELGDRAVSDGHLKPFARLDPAEDGGSVISKIASEISVTHRS
jgi:hypothetical protein